MANILPGDFFAYVNSSGVNAKVAGAELRDRGTYDSSGTYVVLDAAKYSNSLYVALKTVSGTAPYPVATDNWSGLALVQRSSTPLPTTTVQSYSGTWANPNGFVVPANGSISASYYKDDPVSFTDWRWSVTGQTWFPITV